jgi:hypothetical protein
MTAAEGLAVEKKWTSPSRSVLDAVDEGLMDILHVYLII